MAPAATVVREIEVRGSYFVRILRVVDAAAYRAFEVKMAWEEREIEAIRGEMPSTRVCNGTARGKDVSSGTIERWC